MKLDRWTELLLRNSEGGGGAPAADPAGGGVGGASAPAPGQSNGAPAAPASGEPDIPEAAAPAAPTPEPAAPTVPKWVMPRIDTLTRQRAELAEDRDGWRKRAEAAEAALNAGKMGGGDPGSGGTGVTPPAPTPTPTPTGARVYTEEEMRRAAQAEALRIQQINDFNRKSNEAYSSGKATHADWDATVGAINQLGPEVMLPLVSAALETEAPTEVIYHLGKNLDEASRIMALANNPVRMGMEISKLATKVAKPPPAPRPVSSAPAPITPVSPNGGVPDKPTSEMTMDEWMAWRKRTSKLMSNGDARPH